MENGKNNGTSKNSQTAVLKKLVTQSLGAVAIGIALLIVFIVCNFILSRAHTQQTNAIVALEQYRNSSKTLTYSVQSYAVTGQSKYYDAYKQELEVDKSRESALTTLESCGITESEWDKLNQAVALSEGLLPLETKAIDCVEQNSLKAAQACVFSEEYKNSVDQINQIVDELISEVIERTNHRQTILQLAQISIGVLFILSLLFIIQRFIKTISFANTDLLQPIKKVSKQMIALAQGDFGVELDLQEDESEVGQLVASILFMKKNLHNMVADIEEMLEQMGDGKYNVAPEQEYVGEFIKIKEALIVINEKMRETFQTLRNVSGQIDGGAGQLALAAEDLAQSCTDQAAKVSDLVSIFDSITKSMEQNVTGAKDSVQIATEAGLTLTEGNRKMQELKDAIEEINLCSEQISSIINDIEDIASQTNLLSLNAAIEAARAGEAGKGFAVVADQVKKLSEESAEAAGRTTTLIETTVKAVEKGKLIADETAANMFNVMGGAKDATEKMGQIAQLLESDMTQLRKVNENIHQVSAIVDNNSATSQETSAVSEEQKAQVDTMVQLMNQFEI